MCMWIIHSIGGVGTVEPGKQLSKQEIEEQARAWFHSRDRNPVPEGAKLLCIERAVKMGACSEVILEAYRDYLRGFRAQVDPEATKDQKKSVSHEHFANLPGKTISRVVQGQWEVATIYFTDGHKLELTASISNTRNPILRLDSSDEPADLG